MTSHVYFMATMASGVELLDLIKSQVTISGVIGLRELPPDDARSDYCYMKDSCAVRKIDFIEVDSYSLTSVSDRATLENLDIDILIVGGWQRLIPQWLIDQCKICAVGAHGSAYGITGGRGRSPENWALLMGKKNFSISIFKIDAGVDSGRIIDTRCFDIHPTDDIKSARTKTMWLVGQMIIEFIGRKHGELKNATQQTDQVRYLPQRKPEDGELDWTLDSNTLYNSIRALTRPYPGAFSKIDAGTLKIWKAVPFLKMSSQAQCPPGQLIRVLDNTLLVSTGDAGLLITDYECEPSAAHENIVKDHILPSISFMEQGRKIMRRHRKKYPKAKIQEDLIEFYDRFCKH